MAKVTLISVGQIQDQGYRFFVPSYQRGYRWTKREVRQLLEDLWEFANSADQHQDPYYCLQPLVVRKRSDKEYEVLDGQQRLTTLYILMKALREHFGDQEWDPRFEIDYETRERSRQFLKDLPNKGRDEAEANPDFFHMWYAYRMARVCLKKKEKETYQSLSRARFERKFEELLRDYEVRDGRDIARNARFIWYELESQEESSHRIFVRLNSGKVPLTDAELIRGHLLLLTRKHDPSRFEERARLLDDLRLAFEEDPFWFFISTTDYPTRLDRLFELFEGAPVRDDRYTLAHWFLQNHRDVTDLWNDIQSVFAYLRFLYENDEFYNLVGWTVALRENPANTQAYLRGVLKKAREEPKSSLRAYLYREANCVHGRPWLEKKGAGIRIHGLKRDVRDLRYADGQEGIHLRRVLLLHNVLGFFPVEAWRKGCEGRVRGRFPFHRYHGERWSLEHIHPQAPTRFRGYAEAKEWLERMEGALDLLIQAEEEEKESKKIKELKDLRQKVRDLIGEAVEAKEGQFKEFREKLWPVAEEVFQQFGAGDVDDISNIALLPKDLNSRLSNLPFPVKRQVLLVEEEAGAFVPPRTRDVFLKAFEDTPKDFLVWGPESREAYENHIVKTLEAFLNAIERFSAPQDCEKEKTK